MYGLINSAMKEMVESGFGEATWREIHQRADVPDDSYLSMHSYDDKITYDLVGAASQVLEMSPDQCLETFGRYWIHEIAAKTFASMMDPLGQNTVEFIANLNALHDRIASTFVNYVPPDFAIEPVADTADVFRIHYHSTRQGLNQFVVGLLDGMAAHFSDEIVFQETIEMPKEAGTHTIFVVRIQQKPA